MTYFAELIQQLENITTDREAPIGAAVRAALESGGDDDRREAAWAAPAPPPSARRRRAGVRILFPIGVDFEYEWTRGHRLRTPRPRSGSARSISRRLGTAPASSGASFQAKPEGMSCRPGAGASHGFESKMAIDGHGHTLLAWSRIGWVAELYAVFTGIVVAMAVVPYEPAFIVVTKWFSVRRH